jgi:hypothetical protein
MLQALALILLLGSTTAALAQSTDQNNSGRTSGKTQSNSTSNSTGGGGY